MTKKEKLEFRKQLYTKFQNKIDDCLDDLDNKRKLRELLYIFKGYFDATLLEVSKDKSIRQVVQVQLLPQDKFRVVNSEEESTPVVEVSDDKGGEDNE